jgi:hypothetical protein
MRRSDVKVRIYGCVAIITGACNFHVTVNGKESAINPLFHSVWVKTDSGLQFVSWQSTLTGAALAKLTHKQQRARPWWRRLV